MVEPMSLTVGSVVAALVTKAAEKGGENLADAAKAALGRLVGWLRDRFGRDGDQTGVQALAAAEKYGGPVAGQELADAVDGKAATDAGFKAEVERLVARTEQQGVDVKTISQNAWGGNQIAQIADVTGSTISTNFGGQPGTGSPAR